MKYLQNKDNTSNDEVFLSQTDIDANPQAYHRLCTVQRGLRYDMNLYGMWIEKSSTAYSLARLLGLHLYDPSRGPNIKYPRPDKLP
jgi:hypothetical protein